MKDYNTQIVRDRIEVICQKKGVKPTTAAKESGAGQSAAANLKRGSMLAADSLAKLADYLDCSVDYLLGRTDSPNPEPERQTHIEQNHQYIQNDSSPIVFAVPPGNQLDENVQKHKAVANTRLHHEFD